MTKKQLNAMSKDQLIDIAIDQEQKISQIRGYSSGITSEILRLFDNDTLIRCILDASKTFKI